MNIKIYTDGACKGNPGPGGWGFVLQSFVNGTLLRELKRSGGYKLTTNNRMELMAVIEGMKAILSDGNDVEVITDSKYVCDAFNKKWIDIWQKNNWYRKNGAVPNSDLWKQLLGLVSKQNSVIFTWIKGHAGHPYNEECDRMAVRAAELMMRK